MEGKREDSKSTPRMELKIKSRDYNTQKRWMDGAISESEDGNVRDSDPWRQQGGTAGPNSTQ